jgi:hypothetical protein
MATVGSTKLISEAPSIAGLQHRFEWAPNFRVHLGGLLETFFSPPTKF